MHSVGSTIVGDPVTLVAGNNTFALAGVAPGAWLLNYRVFYLSATAETYASDAQILKAFEDAAAEGATIISNSWGRDSFYNKNGLIDQVIVCSVPVPTPPFTASLSLHWCMFTHMCAHTEHDGKVRIPVFVCSRQRGAEPDDDRPVQLRDARGSRHQPLVSHRQHPDRGARRHLPHTLFAHPPTFLLFFLTTRLTTWFLPDTNNDDDNDDQLRMPTFARW